MPLSPGDILNGHYRVEAEIGRGAYGRVYRARDTRLDRPVAIKELAKGVDEVGSSIFSDYVRRFEREARVQAGFNHPNIIHVYELIQEGADRLYLVMEFVDGESLRDVLARRGPLPINEAVQVAADILAGLAAVHADSRDIVHRDIKPSNVMLTKDGRAKLADFGLAQVGDESMRSRAGQPHPGTQFYMSPEQSTSSDYLYPASDIFSVGCVLFEMLAGAPYKRAQRERQTLQELRPDTPPWLSEIVAAALAKEPDKRSKDGAAMGRLLTEARTKAEAEVKAQAEVKARAEAEARTRQEAQRKAEEAAERARLAEEERQRRDAEEQARQAAELQAQTVALQKAAQEAEQHRQADEAERTRQETERKAQAKAEAVQRAKQEQEQGEAAERARQAAKAPAAARRRLLPWTVGGVAVLALLLMLWHPWTSRAPAAPAPTQMPAPTQAREPAALIPTEAPQPVAAPVQVSGELAVGVVLPNKDEPRWVKDGTRFKDALSAAGYSAEILFSQGDSIKERANVEALLKKGIKVLIICPQDSAAAAASAKAARKAGVKVISYDRLITGTDAVDYYIAFDALAIGVQQGQYLVDKAGATKGNPLYLYAGAATDGTAFIFFQGAWSVLQPKIADGTFVIKNSAEASALQGKAELTSDEQAKIIGQVTTNWDYVVAQRLAEANLRASTAADKGNVFILAPNDGTARAIADVFATDKDVTSYYVTGQDAEKTSVQYIIDGRQSMTVFKDIRTLVKDAVATAVAILQGAAPTSQVLVGNGTIAVPMIRSALITVDKANVKTILIDSGYYQASDFTGLQ